MSKQKVPLSEIIEGVKIMRNYNSSANPPPPVIEQGGGEKLVETAGYIPPEKKIALMMQAGQTLKDYREMVYDNKPGEQDDLDSYQIDPTRSGSFDRIDASRLARELGEKARAHVDAVVREKQRQEALKMASATPPTT